MNCAEINYVSGELRQSFLKWGKLENFKLLFICRYVCFSYTNDIVLSTENVHDLHITLTGKLITRVKSYIPIRNENLKNVSGYTYLNLQTIGKVESYYRNIPNNIQSNNNQLTN